MIERDCQHMSLVSREISDTLNALTTPYDQLAKGGM